MESAGPLFQWPRGGRAEPLGASGPSCGAGPCGVGRAFQAPRGPAWRLRSRWVCIGLPGLGSGLSEARLRITARWPRPRVTDPWMSLPA